MNRYLRHDVDTGELRLVLADLWDGQHEVSEYRVIGEDGGRVIRGREDLAGSAVDYRPGNPFPWSIRRPYGYRALSFAVESAPVAHAVTACRIAANRRNRSCPGCDR